MNDIRYRDDEDDGRPGDAGVTADLRSWPAEDLLVVARAAGQLWDSSGRYDLLDVLSEDQRELLDRAAVSYLVAPEPPEPATVLTMPGRAWSELAKDESYAWFVSLGGAIAGARDRSQVTVLESADGQPAAEIRPPRPAARLDRRAEAIRLAAEPKAVQDVVLLYRPDLREALDRS